MKKHLATLIFSLCLTKYSFGTTGDGIDPIELKNYLLQAFSAANLSTNQVCDKSNKSILFIGNTSAGKSTSINYMMGSPMRLERVNGVKAVRAVKEFAKIGHDACSQTSYPESYFDINNGLSYVDCPGFEDDRGLYYEIAANLSTLQIARQSEVSGLVIVISYPSIELQNGVLLKGLVRTLNQFFKNPESIHKSAVFAFNKVPSMIDLEDVIDEIRYLEETSHKLNEQDKRILSLINKSNSIIVNPLDQGASRERLGELLADLTSLDERDFNLALSITSKQKLDSFIKKNTTAGISKLNSFFLFQNSLKNKSDERESREKEEKSWSDNIFREINAAEAEICEIRNTKKALSESLELSKKEINSLKEQIRWRELRIAEKESRLRSTRPDDIILEWSESVENNNLFWGKKMALYPRRNSRNSWLSINCNDGFGSIESIDRYFSSSYGKIVVKIKASTNTMSFWTTNYRRYVEGYEWIESYEDSIKSMRKEVSDHRIKIVQKQRELRSIENSIAQISDKTLEEETDAIKQKLSTCKEKTRKAIKDEKTVLSAFNQLVSQLDSEKNKASFELLEILSKMNCSSNETSEFILLKQEYSKQTLDNCSKM
ncbi:MAG: hypothetical protein AB8G05_17960 [Oligoflexales bacterium]